MPIGELGVSSAERALMRREGKDCVTMTTRVDPPGAREVAVRPGRAPDDASASNPSVVARPSARGVGRGTKARARFRL
jgi:hypothetical protein